MLIVGAYKEFHKEDVGNFNTKPLKSLDFIHGTHIGFFDGDARLGLYGVGMVIFKKRILFVMWLNYGEETNTQVELLALWSVLLFSKQNNVLSIQVYGDSKTIVD